VTRGIAGIALPAEWNISAPEEDQMKRWYDKHPKLARQIEAFKTMQPHLRDKLIADVMGLVKANNPGLLEDFILDFPLDLFRRRWYDKDPYLWLLVNGLKYADPPLLKKVMMYLNEHTEA
jgi:hypothetical protein